MLELIVLNKDGLLFVLCISYKNSTELKLETRCPSAIYLLRAA
jgi:hypothetical protein